MTAAWLLQEWDVGSLARAAGYQPPAVASLVALHRGLVDRLVESAAPEP